MQQYLNQLLLEKYLELDDRGNFIHPPSTDDELDEFIQAAFDCRIPRLSLSPGHRSPFDFVSDLFFERVKNALGFANRSGGKTWTTALLNWLDLVFKPGCEIASAGAVLDQANRCYKYFRAFLDLPWFVEFSKNYHEVTGRPFCSPSSSLRSHTEFGNGSRLEVITGSERGLRGPHPHKFRCDEIDLLEWDVLQTALSMAKSDENIRGQNVFTSTRQYPQGTMQHMLDMAPEKGIEVYQWNVWEILEKCPRRCIDDPREGTCPIYSYCKGKAHHCDGFYKIDDFIDRVRLLDKDKFDTEWLNKKPSRQKLVYHMFDPGRHVMTPEKLFKRYNRNMPDIYWPRVGGLDFGSSPGHPFVYLQFVELPDNAWLLYYEYVAEQRLIRDHANRIKMAPMWSKSQFIYADHDAQDRLELKSNGVFTKSAVKGPGSVNMGIDYLCELLNGYPPSHEPRLYVWYECKFTLGEWGLYSWPIGADGKPDKSGNPKKEHDHTSDAARMALFSHKYRPKQVYRGRNIAGI